MENFEMTPEKNHKSKLWQVVLALALIGAVGFGAWSMTTGGEGGQGMIFKKDYKAEEKVSKEKVSEKKTEKENPQAVAKEDEKESEKLNEKLTEKETEKKSEEVPEPAVVEVDYAAAFEGACPQGSNMDLVYDSRTDNGEGYNYSAMHESLIREIDQRNGSSACPYVFKLYEENSNNSSLEIICDNINVGGMGDRRNEVHCSNEQLLNNHNYSVNLSLLPAQSYGSAYDIPPYFNASLRFNNPSVSYYNNAWSLEGLQIFRVNPEYIRSAFR